MFPRTKTAVFAFNNLWLCAVFRWPEKAVSLYFNSVVSIAQWIRDLMFFKQVLLSLRSSTRTEPLIQSSLESEPMADGDAGTAGAETQMCWSLTNTLPHVYRGMTQYLAIKQPDSLLHSSVFARFISLFSRNTQCRTMLLAVSPPLSLAVGPVAHSCSQHCVSLLLSVLPPCPFLILSS